MSVFIERPNVTETLRDFGEGVPGALDRLMSMVYDDLARMAHRQLGLEPTGHTLATTDLVHEAYLRLVDQTRVEWGDRAHFYAVAAHVMRRVLVDHARRHRATKRGGRERQFVPLEVLESEAGHEVPPDDSADALLAIAEALDRLALLDARQAKVVECRFFAGLTEPETAEALGVTERTVARDWVKARGWLYLVLRDHAA